MAKDPHVQGPLSQHFIDAICFDLDGTLVDSEGEAAYAIELALAPLGRAMSQDEKDFVVGHGFQKIYHYIHSHGGLSLSESEFEEAVYKARVELFARRGASELPFARPIVRWAAQRYPLALVTGSTRREAELMLEALKLRECFRVILCDGEYPMGKPAPEPYLLAAAALGVPPSACLALEDSTAGITSATTAGMVCVAVRAGNCYDQDQSAAHFSIETLNDLPALLGLPATTAQSQ